MTNYYFLLIKALIFSKFQFVTCSLVILFNYQVTILNQKKYFSSTYKNTNSSIYFSVMKYTAIIIIF